MQLSYREATVADIHALHVVRMAVKENVLNTPSLVTTQDYTKFLSTDGKGWLCTAADTVVGFSIVDITSHSIWALFVDPYFENKGIGKTLQKLMLDWYFTHYSNTLWLTTMPYTRADKFYSLTGWTRGELLKNGEVRFELSAEKWAKGQDASQ